MSRPTAPGTLASEKPISQIYKSIRRMVEQDLADTNETLSDQTCTNQSIQGAKMKIESEMGNQS